MITICACWTPVDWQCISISVNFAVVSFLSQTLIEAEFQLGMLCIFGNCFDLFHLAMAWMKKLICWNLLDYRIMLGCAGCKHDDEHNWSSDIWHPRPCSHPIFSCTQGSAWLTALVTPCHSATLLTSSGSDPELKGHQSPQMAFPYNLQRDMHGWKQCFRW